jgi:hypothetical protein
LNIIGAVSITIKAVAKQPRRRLIASPTLEYGAQSLHNVRMMIFAGLMLFSSLFFSAVSPEGLLRSR